MNPIDIAYRYAKALMLVAESHKISAEEIRNVFDVLKPFQQVFTSGALLTYEKHDILQKALSGKIPQILLNFLLLIIDNNRWEYLPEIATGYERLYSKQSPEQSAKVLTPLPIDQNSRNSISQKLESIYHKKIVIQEEITPTILGGLMIFVGNHMIDATLKTKLQKLKKDLLTC